MGQYFIRASDYPLGTRLSSLGFHSVNGEDAEVIETDLLGKAFAVVGEGSGTGRDLTLPSTVIDTTLPYRFHAVTQRAALTSPAGYFVAFDSPNNYFRLGRRNRQLVIERLQNGSFSALASGGNDNDRNDEKQLWSAYIDANQQSISTEFLSGIADPDSLTVNTSNAFLLVSEPGLLFRSGPEEAYDFFEIGIGTNGDPAPTGPVDPGGDEQNVTLVSGQQITQATAVDVNQAAAINAIVSSQHTQSQAAPVQQVAALSSIDGQQVTEADQSNIALTALLGAIEAQQVSQAVSVEISTAAVMDITTVLLEQVTQAQGVTVVQVAQAAAVIAQQLTQGAPLSAEQIADLAAVVVEQITQSQAVDVSIVRPDDLTVAVIEQLTQAQAVTANQSAQVTGLSAESRTQAQVAAVAAEYALVAVTGEQITQAQAVEILDGTGLNVVTMEQATETQAATVTLLALVNGIPAESLQEASTVATAATMLVTANQAQQLTEADIADILGSAMQLDPRELTITRTTAGFHVRRTTPTYRLQFKHSIH